MKGLLLFIGFSIMSLTSPAQQVYRAYETGMATPDSTDIWDYKNTNPANLTITFQNKAVKLNDREKSVFHLKEKRIAETNEQIQSYVVWEAVDKSGTNCDVSIIQFRNDTTRIQITYLKKKTPRIHFL